MSRLIPFRYRLFILCTMLAFTVAAGSAMSFVDIRHPGAKAKEWADAAKANGTLPTTLAEFEEYPRAYRKAAFRRVTPEVRSALMREHFTKFMETNELNAEQRALVERIIAMATPALYTEAPAFLTKKKERPELLNLKPVCQEIPRLFSEEQRAAFSSIGHTNVAPEGRYVNWVRRAKGWLGEPVLLADSDFHECDCAEDTACPDCGHAVGCTFGSVPECSDTWFGCGCASAWPCEGECKPIVCCN